MFGSQQSQSVSARQALVESDQKPPTQPLARVHTFVKYSGALGCKARLFIKPAVHRTKRTNIAGTSWLDQILPSTAGVLRGTHAWICCLGAGKNTSSPRPQGDL